MNLYTKGHAPYSTTFHNSAAVRRKKIVTKHTVVQTKIFKIITSLATASREKRNVGNQIIEAVYQANNSLKKREAYQTKRVLSEHIDEYQRWPNLIEALHIASPRSGRLVCP